MAYESNNGSVYYAISCGVPTVSGYNPNINNGTQYLYVSGSDYILWGQPTLYIHPSSNNGSMFYFLQCIRSTDSGWSPSANNGTKFWYNSSFNCISFCY